MEVVWLVDFDLPAVDVGVDGLVLGRTRGCDNEAFAVIQAQRGQVDEASPDRTPPWQQVSRARFDRAQQGIDPRHPVPMIGNWRVAFDPLMEGDPLRLQPPEPRLAHEFAVGQQDGDPRYAKDRKEALHQGHALGGVAIARLAQDVPGHRQGDAAIGDTQHQEINIHRAELPVSAIQRQSPRAVTGRDQAHPQPCPGIRVDLKRAEEALQTLVA